MVIHPGLRITLIVQRFPSVRFLIQVVLFQPTVTRMAQLPSAQPVPVFPSVVSLHGGNASVPAPSSHRLSWLPTHGHALSLPLPGVFCGWASLGTPVLGPAASVVATPATA